MKVSVRFFAHFLGNLPDKRGWSESVVTLPDGSTIAHLIEQLRISAELPKVILVNGMQKDVNAKLFNEDIVSILPLVSGG